MDQPRSILIVKPSSFGDVVHTLPAVARIRRAWPKARLAWVINPEWAPLLDGNPTVDEVIPFPRQEFRGWTGAGKFWRWCQAQLRARQPDLAVDFQGLLRSALIGRASRPIRLVGMADAREGARWLYSQTVGRRSGAVHAVERYLAAADDAAALYGHEGGGPAEAIILSFPLPEGEPPGLRNVELPKNFILLHPFARGEGKSLPEASIRELCRNLMPRPVVLVGRGGNPARGAWPENCTDLLNQTSLLQLIWLIRRAKLIVTVDSGPSHLAAALGQPMIALHTWSDPRQVGPYRPDAWVWKNGTPLQVRELPDIEESFFRRTPPVVSEKDTLKIAELAISLLDSCA